MLCGLGAGPGGLHYLRSLVLWLPIGFGQREALAGEQGVGGEGGWANHAPCPLSAGQGCGSGSFPLVEVTAVDSIATASRSW